MRLFVVTGLVLAIGFAAADRVHAAPVRAAALVEAAGMLAATEQVQYRPGHYRRSGYTTRDQMIRARHREWRERMRVRQDVTRIFDAARRVTVNRARNADRAHRAMQDYLRR